jgi:hypothetical protein
VRSSLLLVLLIILGLVFGSVALQWPEIRRYLKIRAM